MQHSHFKYDPDRYWQQISAVLDGQRSCSNVGLGKKGITGKAGFEASLDGSGPAIFQNEYFLRTRFYEQRK